MIGPIFEEDEDNKRRLYLNSLELALLRVLRGTFKKAVLGKFIKSVRRYKITKDTLKNWNDLHLAFQHSQPLIPKEYVRGILSDKFSLGGKVKEYLVEAAVTQIQKKLFFTYTILSWIAASKKPSISLIPKIIKEVSSHVRHYSTKTISFDPLAIEFLIASKIPLEPDDSPEGRDILQAYHQCLNSSEKIPLDPEKVLDMITSEGNM